MIQPLLVATIWGIVALPISATVSADDELPHGLVATYRARASDAAVARIDADVQFNWSDASPDPRVPAERFEVVWRGKLLVPASGEYRFHLFHLGTARLSIGGTRVIDGRNDKPAWSSSERRKFEAGHHAIDVSFAKTAPQAQIGLFWESKKFGIEPVMSRWLYHDRVDGREPGDFERGEELVRALRCAACHTIPGTVLERHAPTLDRLAGRINPDWLVEWLENPHALEPRARMPATGLSRDDARAVAAYLVSAGKKSERPATPATNKGNRDAGEALVRSLGCLACHTFNGSGSANVEFGGGALDRVADKRPDGFFREWLTKPQSSNAAHRMPTFSLSKDEVDDLASFLASCRKQAVPDAPRPAVPVDANEINRGRQLVIDHRCAACHDISGTTKPDMVGEPLHGERLRRQPLLWQRSCMSQAETTVRRPRFVLDERDRRALVTFIEQLPADVARQSRYEMGRRLMRELNCTACHARDLEQGLQPAIVGRADGAAAETELAKLRGELEPPSLTSVGDKFTDEMLAKLIAGGHAPRRPWLKVRMPRFEHRDTERDAIVAFLVDHDRVPTPLPAPVIERVAGSESSSLQPKNVVNAAGGSKPQSPARRDSEQPQPLGGQSDPNQVSPVAAFDPAAALTAGHQLVSSRGFGCMSCHIVGKHQPKNVEANARGSDLLKIGDRVRHEWFIRWTRDPARIVPGMEMPAITLPVAGVLDGRIDLQVESLWQALNSPSFVVPSDRDTAQQIISLKPGDEPVILRDVMYDCPPGSGWCPRAFAIGLPSRHNVLFDLDTMSLRGWWLGDFARERTEGKTWLWEPAGLPVIGELQPRPSIVLRKGQHGDPVFPKPKGQTEGTLRSWGNVIGSAAPKVYFEYELSFSTDLKCEVRERLWPISRADMSGFYRHITLFGLPEDSEFQPYLVHTFPSAVATAGRTLTVTGPIGQVTIAGDTALKWVAVALDGEARPALTAHLLPLMKSRTRPGSTVFEYTSGVEYLTLGAAENRRDFEVAANVSGPGSGADAAGSARPKSGGRTVEELSVVPGHDSARLPLGRSVMPTAIAFRSDGVPVVSSLKGQVFLARDTDGDHCVDSWQEFSDHLAAPFGLLADGNDVIVSHKPELVRLGDPKDSGKSRRADVLASGWGVTEDYHDWTFGVVRDAAGSMYIATGSDYAHKNRPTDARRWRGSVLKVSPRGEVEELARGARYPTGLAMNRDGAVFFTDNQGVQNTFNEINHVIPGSRYGVPSQDDPPPEADPWPVREPAIKIPHPWTRSINGICFLESGGKWGPFEGHGIGCEYDTRGLIRFSLQKIDDTYQGACYPFTLPEDQVPQDQRLLGPICCAVSPNGDLYVGGLRDSGWGGGNNVGELVRIKPSPNVPLGIREVRAWREGFVIEFTGAVDPTAATVAATYTISSYHRIWKGTYATPDSDRRNEKITRIELAADRRSVVVTLDSMRPGFVYDFQLKLLGAGGHSLWPAEAYYTLNRVPDMPRE